MKSINNTIMSLHADMPEVTVAGIAGASVLVLRFLRHPNAQAAPARMLKNRMVVSVPERTNRQYGSHSLEGKAKLSCIRRAASQRPALCI